MRFEPREKIDPKALTVWQIVGGISSAIVIAVVIGLFVIALNTDFPFWITASGGCLALVLLYVDIEIIPKLRYKRWRYEVSEQEIDIQHGIWIVKRTLVPMVRVQHVDTKQGPILRKYQLATVTISTAATTHEIPALSVEEASTLRDRIGELARTVDEDE